MIESFLALRLLSRLVWFAGLAHLASLAAMLYAPVHLRAGEQLARLPRLLRQMCHVYSLYTSGTILALGLASVLLPGELSNGTPLARAVCGYVAVFWLARLILQFIYDSRPYLSSVALRASYHALTVLFLIFVVLYGWLAFRP